MKTLRTRFSMLAAAVSVVAVMATPALAGGGEPAAAGAVEEGTPGNEDDGGHGEEADKIQLPASSHHKFGLIIVGASIVFGLIGLDNARRRLKGEGEKATGEFRWR